MDGLDGLDGGAYTIACGYDHEDTTGSCGV